MSARVVGQRARRIEDPALLRGAGRYADDIHLPGMLHAAFVRSPHAHALVRSVRAPTFPGVIAIYTAKELNLKRLPLGFPTSALPEGITPYALAPAEVCFVGEAVAMVIAESRYLAEDAAALVEVEYEPLPIVADLDAALAPDAPRARLESPNVLTQFRVGYGDCATVFKNSSFTFKESLEAHRGAAHPIEGRGLVVQYDPGEDRMTVWSSSQMAHDIRLMIAELLGMPEERIRVAQPDVGGGFGAKFLVYPEEIAVAAAARLLGRPLKWIEDRLEHFLGALQERDQRWEMEIAADRDGRIRGVRGRLLHDQGAYMPQGINCAYNAATSVTGPYVIPAYDLDVVVAQTNKVFVVPVRGAGYPQAAFIMERLLDRVARELKLDRAEVRRINLVPAEKMPYTKALKNRAGAPLVLDSGDYPRCQEKVLQAISYETFPARQAAARKQNRHIGIGIAHGVKGTGRGPFESGIVRVSPTGRVTVATGALAMGQGLRTALAQICAEQLGLALEQIDVVSGDTASVSLGMGGFASRQTVTAGSSVHFAALKVREKAIKVAAQLLEAAEADLDLEEGSVVVKGTDRSVSLGKIARLLRGIPGYAMPAGVEAGLEASFNWQTDQMAYAHSFHACEVEVDVETGGVKILRYVALQDSGKLVNPSIVEGQVHGGIVHGIGNSLFEEMRYDENAQPLTTTLADYLLPTSTEVPNLEVLLHESPSPFNPLGAKGVGEGGTVPVAGAIISAIEDALSPFNVRIRRAPVNPVMLLEMIEKCRSS
ncbi:MAG TPA: xanthine dehydrogenase family protein molybdopterin-binding subunit [Burkholderiales bacterium]